MTDFSFLQLGGSPEAQAESAQQKAEQDALAIQNADKEWIECCQELPREELEQVIHEGQSPIFEGDEHYTKRYGQARDVYIERFGNQ